MNEHPEPGHPIGPEIDDTQNPTAAAPAGDDAAPDERRAPSGKEMLAQLQKMIDSLAVQAGPVMRDVAAKAAELAAIAGEKAGPLAHKAAETTERVGQRVATRSKEMAAEWRRPPGSADEAAEGSDAADGLGAAGGSNASYGSAEAGGSADTGSEEPRQTD